MVVACVMHVSTLVYPNLDHFSTFQLSHGLLYPCRILHSTPISGALLHLFPDHWHIFISYAVFCGCGTCLLTLLRLHLRLSTFVAR
jgi:hypothetical protein